MKTYFFIIFISLCLSACSDDDFTRSSELGSFKVLAVKANTPELNINSLPTTIDLELYLSDLNSESQSITVSLEGCYDIGFIDEDGEIDCEKANDKQNLTFTAINNSGASGEFDSSLGLRTGLYQTYENINIPKPPFDFLKLPPADQFNGRPYIIVISITTNNITQKVIKRINITNRTSNINTNPLPASKIVFDDIAVSSQTKFPNKETKITIEHLPNSKQGYSLIDNTNKTKQVSEQLSTSWFLSAGNLTKDSSLEDQYTTFKKEDKTIDLTKPHILVAVTRDERGGVQVDVIEFAP